MKIILSAFLAFIVIAGNAQFAPFQASLIGGDLLSTPDLSYNFKSNTSKRLYQRNIGMIIGWQRGRYDALELGGEAHWRKISVLNKPHIIGATTNLEYYISQHVIGYKAGLWMKRGRVNLTYGANVSYFNDFHDGSRFGIGPSIGFRLMGFHLTNGYNFLTKDKNIDKIGASPAANTLYISLRYYFPVENKFVWDRNTMRKKRDKRKQREKRKEERIEKRENGETGLKSLFNFHKNKDDQNSKKDQEKDGDNKEKKGLRKLFDFGKH